jgi:hypothetical protein
MIGKGGLKMANVKSFISRLSHSEVLALLGQGVRVYNSPDSPLGQVPSPFVQPAVVQEVYDGFKSANDAAQSGAPRESNQRNALRIPFNKTMVDFIDLVELAARNDGSIAYKFGMDFLVTGTPTKSTSRSAQTSIPVLTVEAIDKEPTKIRGKVRGGARKGLEIYYTYDDPTQEANWLHFDSFASATFIMGGLTSGRRAYVRARYITSNGKGPWSDLISIMVP